jgi:hypothetical protein
MSALIQARLEMPLLAAARFCLPSYRAVEVAVMPILPAACTQDEVDEVFKAAKEAQKVLLRDPLLLPSSLNGGSVGWLAGRTSCRPGARKTMHYRVHAGLTAGGVPERLLGIRCICRTGRARPCGAGPNCCTGWPMC